MHQLVKHLFRAGSLEEVSLEQLEKLVEEYPSFSIGHYLLSKKLRKENADNFNAETQRTSLYFSNPFWLQWQLQNGEGSEIADQPVVRKGAAVDETRVGSDEPVAEVQLVEAEQPGGGNGDYVVTETGEYVLADRERDSNSDAASTAEEPAAPESPFIGDETVKEGNQALGKGPAGPEAEISAAADTIEQPATSDIPESSSVGEKTVASEGGGDAEPAAFEPYHMVDYFASQGIKLVLEDNPTDKLGQQLKSFTDWLKVMKRLPQKEKGEAAPSDIAIDKTIQTIAAHSIVGRDVVTETMAEVLVKQGMQEKAVEVYRKLSLLNPDKSAYFAAKIEQLKIN